MIAVAKFPNILTFPRGDAQRTLERVKHMFGGGLGAAGQVGAGLGVGRGATGEFSPTDIAGLRLWLKADGTLWQNSTRTTPVTANSQRIGAWDDASGQGNHLLQADDNIRPTYLTNIKNGLPAMGIGTNTNHRVALTLGSAISQPYTIFAVGLSNSAFVGGSYFSTTGAVNRGLYQNNPGAQVSAMSAGTGLTNANTATGWFLMAGLFNSTSSKLRRNGVERASGNAGTGTITVFQVGEIGNAWAVQRYAEILVYAALLTDVQVSAVETYLNSRWAIY